MELIDVLDQGVSLYGYSKQFEKKTNAVCHETLYSLMLSLLPPQSHQRGEIAVIPGGRKELTLLATAVQALISYAGFQLPQVSVIVCYSGTPLIRTPWGPEKCPD